MAERIVVVEQELASYRELLKPRLQAREPGRRVLLDRRPVMGALIARVLAARASTA
jgi:hypothetical protein